MEVVKQLDVMKFLRPNSNFQFLFVQEKKKKQTFWLHMQECLICGNSLAGLW